jgi:hypothetical protein
MADTVTMSSAGTESKSRTRLPRIPVLVFGLSLSIFLALIHSL